MSSRVGVAGIVAALSVVSDLTRGHPPGEAMRACLVATELARRNGATATAQAHVYYATLLRFAGCAATSHEAALALGGDDVAVRARGDLMDATRPAEAMRFLAGLGTGMERLRLLARAPRVPGIVEEGARADCEVGVLLTRQLDMPDEVNASVLCAFERYDGKGAPAGIAGDALPEAARFAAVGFTAVMFDAVGGSELAEDVVRRWSGRALDPSIASLFLADVPALLALSDAQDVWSTVVVAEPSTPRSFRDDAHLDTVLAAYGDAADLKAPWFQGHARGVSALAAAAASGLDGAEPALLRRAGLLHDLGRVAVSTGTWERAGALRPEEWDQVRLHPYHSSRILSRTPVLAPVGALVARHHERLDRSGYPAGVGGAELDASARVLAAADVWHALRSARPHRPALSVSEAAATIAEMPLDRGAVRAVLTAAEAPRSDLPRLPVSLTDRELDVLRLLVAGSTKRQIAERLVVSASTVHTHTVHIYAKCEVSTRAGLAMFAMEHGLTTLG